MAIQVWVAALLVLFLISNIMGTIIALVYSEDQIFNSDKHKVARKVFLVVCIINFTFSIAAGLFWILQALRMNPPLHNEGEYYFQQMILLLSLVVYLVLMNNLRRALSGKGNFPQMRVQNMYRNYRYAGIIMILILARWLYVIYHYPQMRNVFRVQQLMGMAANLSRSVQAI